MTEKQRRGRRTFTVSRGRAFVGSVLGDDLGKHSPEELEDLVQHMEEYFAKVEAEEGPETPGVQSPEE